jgi:hypothetical protein
MGLFTGTDVFELDDEESPTDPVEVGDEACLKASEPGPVRPPVRERRSHQPMYVLSAALLLVLVAIGAGATLPGGKESIGRRGSPAGPVRSPRQLQRHTRRTSSADARGVTRSKRRNPSDRNSRHRPQRSDAPPTRSSPRSPSPGAPQADVAPQFAVPAVTKRPPRPVLHNEFDIEGADSP